MDCGRPLECRPFTSASERSAAQSRAMRAAPRSAAWSANRRTCAAKTAFSKSISQPLNAAESDGSTRYCFTDAEGRESPNLRVNPGDQVIIHLKNAMTMPEGRRALEHLRMYTRRMAGNSCTSGAMSSSLHQSAFPRTDDSSDLSSGRCIKDLIAAGRPRLRIPLSDSRR